MTDHYLKKELYTLLKREDTIFEFLQLGSLDGIWYWNLENQADEWMSPQFWELFGFDPAEKKHLASEWQNLIFQEDLQIAMDNFKKHCADPNHPYDQIVRYRHKNGSTVWVRCRGIAMRDKTGKPIRMLGAHTDITDYKLTEEELKKQTADCEKIEAELKEKSNFLEKIIETTALSTWISDENGTAIRANPACLRFFGATEEEVIGKYNLFKDEVIERNNLMPVIRNVFKNAEHANFIIDYDFGEVKHVDAKSPTHKVVNSIFTPIVDHENRVTNVIVQTIDLTDLKKHEKALRQSEEREKELADIVRKAPVAIAYGYPDGRLDQCNTAFSKLTGYSPEELKTIDWNKTLTPPKWNQMEAEKLDELLRTKQSVTYEKEYIRKDGTLVPIELYVFLSSDKGGDFHYIAFITDITERKNAELALKENEQRLRAVGDNLPLASTFQLMVTPDGQSIFTYISNAVKQLHECTPEEVLADSSKLFSRVVEEDLEGLQKATEKSIREMEIFNIVVRIRRKSGAIRWHRLTSRPRKNEDNAVIFDGIDIDITQQKLTEMKMAKLVSDLNERVKELNCLYNIAELVRKPDLSIIEILQGAVDIIPQSWQFPEETCARVLIGGQEIKTRNFKQTEWKLTRDIVASKKKVGVLEIYYMGEKPDSGSSPFLKEEDKLISVIAEKLDRSIEYQNTQDELNSINAQLERMATHDFLTGLPNRMLFDDRLAQGIMLSKRKGKKAAVCIADMDDFKQVNDKFGHQYGDQALKEVAGRLQSALRGYDTLSRLGGDEFSILILDVESKREVAIIIERMLKTVNQKLVIGTHRLKLSLSIGVAMYPDDGDTREKLMNKADKAMYECKGKGKNRYNFFKN